MISPARRAEWERLCEERVVARKALVRAIASLNECAKDPLGVRAALRRHPWILAGGAAALGALLVNLVPSRQRRADPADRRAHAGRDGFSPILDTVLHVAEPWLEQLVAEYLGPPGGIGEARHPDDPQA